MSCQANKQQTHSSHTADDLQTTMVLNKSAYHHEPTPRRCKLCSTRITQKTRLTFHPASQQQIRPAAATATAFTISPKHQDSESATVPRGRYADRLAHTSKAAQHRIQAPEKAWLDSESPHAACNTRFPCTDSESHEACNAGRGRGPGRKVLPEIVSEPHPWQKSCCSF